MKSVALLAALLISAAPALAAPAITLVKAWVRPAPVGGVTAGYFTLVNRGGLADRLTGASSPIAERVGLHESHAVGAVMTMRPLAAVAVPGHGVVTFAPVGRHLMIERLRRSLHIGDTVPIALDFDRAGRIIARFQVRAAPP